MTARVPTSGTTLSPFRGVCSVVGARRVIVYCLAGAAPRRLLAPGSTWAGIAPAFSLLSRSHCRVGHTALPRSPQRGGNGSWSSRCWGAQSGWCASAKRDGSLASALAVHIPTAPHTLCLKRGRPSDGATRALSSISSTLLQPASATPLLCFIRYQRTHRRGSSRRAVCLPPIHPLFSSVGR